MEDILISLPHNIHTLLDVGDLEITQQLASNAQLTIDSAHQVDSTW